MNHKQEIEAKYDVTCLHVVESGSRAWGFASPDSDWDIRFIYTHNDKNKYLKLHNPSDVIIFENGDIEYHGWDIKKALILAGKSNVSFYEWAASPVVYHAWRKPLQICRDAFSLKDTCHHYRGLAKHTYVEYCAGSGEKTLKKFLYVIRPIFCMEYILRNSALPPIDFNQLMSLSEIDDEFRDMITELLDIKVNHPERKTAPKNLDDYFTKWCKDNLDRFSHDFINENIAHREMDWGYLNRVYNEVIGELPC